MFSFTSRQPAVTAPVRDKELAMGANGSVKAGGLASEKARRRGDYLAVIDESGLRMAPLVRLKYSRGSNFAPQREPESV